MKNKLYLIHSMVLGLACVTSSAWAESGGIISVKGALNTGTCDVTLGLNSTGTEFTLPTVPKSSFTSVGDTVGSFPLIFNLSDCNLISGTSSSVYIYLTHASATADGFVPNDTGTSSNVGWAFKYIRATPDDSAAIDNSGADVKVNDRQSFIDNSVINLDATTGEGQVIYSASYVALSEPSALVAGTVQSVVTWSVEYP